MAGDDAAHRHPAPFRVLEGDFPLELRAVLVVLILSFHVIFCMGPNSGALMPAYLLGARRLDAVEPDARRHHVALHVVELVLVRGLGFGRFTFTSIGTMWTGFSIGSRCCARQYADGELDRLDRGAW